MIRNATPDDAEGIGAVWNPIIRETEITFWPTPRSNDEIAKIITERQAAGYAFLVAEDDSKEILGFSTYTQFRGGAGYAKSLEHSINLGPAARGKGLGAKLLSAVERHATERGGRLMIGGITATNLASIRFHEAQGYSEWGRIPAAGWKFNRFHDLVFMGKDLRA